MPSDPQPISVGLGLNGGFEEDLMEKLHSPGKSASGPAPDPCVHRSITRGGPEVVAHDGAIQQIKEVVQGFEKSNMLGNLSVGLEEANTGDGPLGQVALTTPQFTTGPLELVGPVSPHCQSVHLESTGIIPPVSFGLPGLSGLVSPQQSVAGPQGSANLVSPLFSPDVNPSRSTAQNCNVLSKPVSSAMKVYSRRRQQELSCQDEAPGDESPSKQQLFFKLVSKSIGSLLPTPKPMKKKKRLPAPPPQELRRNRRVAGLGAEHIQQFPRSKKMVLRALRIDPGRDHLNHQDLDGYAKLFSQPLSCLQVQALASLFGWIVPDDAGGAATLVC